MDMAIMVFKATLLIMGIMTAWLAVQHAYRRFAGRHPEFGPAIEHLGCGMACTCNDPCEHRIDGTCTYKDNNKADMSTGEHQ